MVGQDCQLYTWQVLTDSNVGVQCTCKQNHKQVMFIVDFVCMQFRKSLLVYFCLHC